MIVDDIHFPDHSVFVAKWMEIKLKKTQHLSSNFLFTDRYLLRLM